MYALLWGLFFSLSRPVHNVHALSVARLITHENCAQVYG